MHAVSQHPTFLFLLIHLTCTFTFQYRATTDMDSNTTSSPRKSRKAISSASASSVMRSTFRSFPREIRNIVYDELWASRGVISTHLNGILLRVYYSCVGSINAPFAFGIPTWLLTCESFLFEALDLLRLNSIQLSLFKFKSMSIHFFDDALA